MAASTKSSPKPHLKLKHEKILPSPLRPALISICPQLDLIAAATSESSVEIFRFHGHRALLHKRTTSDATVLSIQWSPNNRLLRERDGDLVITWSDGLAEAIDIESGKALYSIRTSKRAPQTSPISCFSWSSHRIASNTTRDGPRLRDALQARTASSINLADTIDKDFNVLFTETSDKHTASLRSDLSESRRIASFPQQLALLDLSDQLPKLSPIAHVEDSQLPNLPSADRFLTQASVDLNLMVDQPGQINVSDVDVKIVCDASGSVATYAYNEFDIGNYNMFDSAQTPRAVRHSSTFTSSCHAFLIQNGANNSSTNTLGAYKGSLSLSTLDLGAIPRSGIFLRHVVKLTMRLNGLLQYILLTIVSMRSAWSSAQDLPAKFMSNINESLVEEKQPLDLIQSFYQVALTGSCPPPVHEWLKEQLGERGHKRWDQAVSTGYAKMLDLAHNYLLPALEHASLTTSRLRALSRTPDIPIFEADEKPLTDILSVLDICRIHAHTILSYTAEESRQFRVFSNWLQLLIQYVGAEPESSSAQETAEKMAETDYPRLLTYITGALTRSHLSPFLETATKTVLQGLRENPSLPNYNKVVDLLAQHRRSPLPSEPPITDPLELLRMALLAHGLWKSEFHNIPKNFSAYSHIEKNFVLEQATTSDIMDIRMVEETTADGIELSIYVCVVPEHSRNQVRLHRLSLTPISNNNPSTPRINHAQVVTIDFGRAQIHDVKFLNDAFLLVLLRSKDLSHIVHLPYSADTTTAHRQDTARPNPAAHAPAWSSRAPSPRPGLSSSPAAHRHELPPVLLDSDEKLAQTTLRYALPHSPGEGGVAFVPGSVEVREDGRGTTTYLVLDELGTRWRIFEGVVEGTVARGR